MRLNLDADTEEFTKQVRDLRRFLNKAEAAGDAQAVMCARLMTVGFLPLLIALRTEIRSGAQPVMIAKAVAGLIGNIAVTSADSISRGQFDKKDLETAIADMLEAAYAETTVLLMPLTETAKAGEPANENGTTH